MCEYMMAIRRGGSDEDGRLSPAHLAKFGDFPDDETALKEARERYADRPDARYVELYRSVGFAKKPEEQK